MAFNTFGNLLKLTTFGESHGLAIGGIIDGFPAGVSINFEAIQDELDRRKPGQSKIVTQRKEPDTVEFLSGIFEGKPQELLLDLLLKTPTKNHTITLIILMYTDHLMQITPMIKNLELEIIVVVVVPLLEKQLIG
jgi:chorismate synthase